mgnify:CR=1 FL=1
MLSRPPYGKIDTAYAKTKDISKVQKRVERIKHGFKNKKKILFKNK